VGVARWNLKRFEYDMTLWVGFLWKIMRYKSFFIVNSIEEFGARGSAVLVSGSIPDGVTGILH
jgi:hypothetical protein